MATTFKTVDEKRFRTPDMGVYYDEDLIEELLENIDPGKGRNASYYVEEPFSTVLGYHVEEDVFVIKADPIIKRFDKTYGGETGAENEYLNAVDADTIPFHPESILDGGGPFTINGQEYRNFEQYVYAKMKTTDIDFNEADFTKKVFKIRTLGINAPETPHYVILPQKDSQLKLVEITIEEAKANGYIYEINAKRTEGEKYPFIYAMGQWREVVKGKDAFGKYGLPRHPFSGSKKYGEDDNKEQEDVRYYTCVQKDEQTLADMEGELNLGEFAKQVALDLLNESRETLIIIDNVQLSKSKQYTGLQEILTDPWTQEVSFENMLRTEYISIWGQSQTNTIYRGFNAFGQDAYKRFLGAIYCKKNVDGVDVWINLAKYVRARVGSAVEIMRGVDPASQHLGNYTSDAFKIWSYDNSNSVIADGFYNLSQADFDDRRAIQKEITGLDFSTYRDYTVMIGDCLFMVPPTSIRVVNQVESQRVPLLRSKGTMVKTKPHNDRIIEITLYFNGDEGINGFPIQRQLPRQIGTNQYETYYMNGLRSLIAMFKFTPFLPIENHYLNDVLGIEAVTLANLQIQTIPMYPKCLGVTLTLQQFNYRIYMNELPLPDPEKGEDYNTNVFARTINYGIMRYYYQRALQAGNELKGIPTTHQDFIEATMGSKTRLIPTTFDDQRVGFQILDENWLKKMKEVKQLAEKQALNQVQPLSNSVVAWANQIGVSMYHIIKVMEKFNNATSSSLDTSEDYRQWLYEQLIKPQICPYLTQINHGKAYDGAGFQVEFVFDTNSITSQELQNLALTLTAELDITKTESDRIAFQDGILKLTVLSEERDDLTVDDHINNEKLVRYWTDTTTGDYKVAEYLAFKAGQLEAYVEEMDFGDWDDFSTVKNEEYYEEMKQSIDTETLLSAKFIDYPLNIVAQQFSISMGNMISNTKLKIEEGYAPQYAGGQDTVIDFMFHTQDEGMVGLLNNLQEKAAQYLIDYREVIRCFPIRIDSEITRLCGVYEVLIESIDIATVPMQPGLFAIQVRAISVDRTVRNREALDRIDAINNAGAVNPVATNSWVYKTYFDLNNTLAQTEVYPDLELPTINELESTGYKFLKYQHNRGNRIYPDPDFYFVYGHAYSSQMLRKSIVEYFDKTITDENGVSDTVINKIRYSLTQKDTNQEILANINTEDRNQVMNYEFQNTDELEAFEKARQENIEQSVAARNKNMEQLKSDKAKLLAAEKLYDANTAYEEKLMTFNPYSWDICPDVKCSIPEVIPSEDTSYYESAFYSELSLAEQELIQIIDEVLSKPIDSKFYEASKIKTGEKYQKDLRNAIKSFARGEAFGEDNGDSTWKKIFNVFGAGVDAKSIDMIRGIYEAAAIALSGNSEYNEKADPATYCARAFFTSDSANSKTSADNEKAKGTWYPHSIIIDEDTGAEFNAKTKENAIANGVTFGPYQVRIYDVDYLKEFYADQKIKITRADFLDPYYNQEYHKAKFGKEIDPKEYREYKERMITSAKYSIAAFHRIVLLWVKKLILDKLFISYYDLRRDDIAVELAELYKAVTGDKLNDPQKKVANYTTGVFADQTTQNQYTPVYDSVHGYIGAQDYASSTKEAVIEKMEGISAITDETEELYKLVETYDTSLVSGKVFLAIACAVTHGDPFLYDKLENRDVGNLKTKTRNAQLPYNIDDDLSQTERTFRKLLRGLGATDPKVVTRELSSLGGESYTKIESALIDRNQKLWCSASKDPSLWILHSFYDMVVNNKRGRMARAFPTYYMMLIDEGREIGYWKLHDNFYNMSSIAEIEVTKSRKIAADTARIVMTNMYKTFTTEDEDIKTNYTHNLKDVWNSIFSPNIYFEQEEAARMAQNEVNRATIKPGVRIHLRMGYSGNAADLPILFNGVVAEASTGEMIEIIAQSDGHEINNSQVFAGTTAMDAADLKNESSAIKWISNFFTEGATPKTLIRNVLTTKSGFWGTVANKFTNGRFFNDNMFGVTHFGELDFKSIHKDGEVMQNIYEAEGRMPWQQDENPDSLTAEHATREAPHFTIELKDKSVWDVLNICASSSLEFIAGIAPFGIRSTIFHGRPHYYYAYDYDFDDNGLIVEKRKPFQQYHIIDSYSDIIGNNIKATGRDLKTVAVPVYKGPGLMNGATEKKLEPIWADWDIYPEYQKTMLVNTGMQWKANKLGFAVVNKLRDEWGKNNGQKIAWRMGATALKNAMKDMYEGEVIIIGDTSIKPYDKVFLYDVYENMNGAVEVEAVVHSLNSETGFTTSVFVDCINCVDSRYEEVGNMMTTQIVNQMIAIKSFMYAQHIVFKKTTRPFLNAIAKTVNKAAFKTMTGINSMANMVDLENMVKFVDSNELIKYSSMEKWSTNFYKSVGLTSNQLPIWSNIDALKSWSKSITIPNATNISSTAEALDSVKDLIKSADDFDTTGLRNALQAALDDGTIKQGQIENVKDAIKQLDELKLNRTNLDDSIKQLAKAVSNELDDVGNMAQMSDEIKDSYIYLKSINTNTIIDSKTASKIVDSIDNVKDLTFYTDDIAKSVSSFSKYGDDVAKIATKVDDVAKVANASAGAATGFATASLASAAVVFAIELAITYIIEKSIYNWIENRMASFNVLTIYPLKKNSVPYVAGIDGHKGLVYGSPTWNTPGPIDNFINWAFKDRDGFWGVVQDIFYSSEMKAIAETYKKDNKLGSYTDAKEQTITELLSSISANETSAHDSFVGMLKYSRALEADSPEAHYSLAKTAVKEDLEDLPDNHMIKEELVVISSANSALEKYFENGVLKTIHMSHSEYTETVNNAITYEPFTASSSTAGAVTVRGIRLDEERIDIPFLRPDAFQIFKKIIDLIIDYTGNKKYGEDSNISIWFKSGTVVNDTSWSSTGYVFRFEAVNVSDEIVEACFTQIHNIITEIYIDRNQKDIINMVQHRKIPGSNAYEVAVAPRNELSKLHLW